MDGLRLLELDTVDFIILIPSSEVKVPSYSCFHIQYVRILSLYFHPVRIVEL